MKRRSTPSKKLRYLCEYAVYLLLSPIVRGLSSRAVFRLGRFLGTLGYFIAGKRKRIASINLDIAFGGTYPRWRKSRIIKHTFIQLAVSALQCWWLGTRTRERIGEVTENIPEGLDVLKACLARGKGVFFLTAHYGNWEAMGVNHGYLDIAPLYSIARKLDNPYLEKVAMKFRTTSGNGIFYKDEFPIKIVRALKNNSCVAIMMDQNTAKGAVFVDFFNKPAATPRSIAVLSYSTGAPIVPLFSYPTGKGTYKIKYGPELKLEKTGNKETDILNWTQVCEKHIESVIRERPEPWIWGHRRWKTRPPEEKGLRLYDR